MVPESQNEVPTAAWESTGSSILPDCNVLTVPCKTPNYTLPAVANLYKSDSYLSHLDKFISLKSHRSATIASFGSFFFFFYTMRKQFLWSKETFLWIKDDNAFPVLACHHWLSTACQYQLTSTGAVLNFCERRYNTDLSIWVEV